jgi:hypothetical protein
MSHLIAKPSGVAQALGRDLLGRPLPPSTPRSRPAPPPARPAPPACEVPVVRNLTDDDIASFQALGAEICLATEGCGEIWLVPAYTGRADRRELSVRDAATLAAICSAFPGASVARFAPASEEKCT